jgi:hypothetical protein
MAPLCHRSLPQPQLRTLLVESVAGLTEARQVRASLGEEYHVAMIEMALGWWVEAERSRPASHSQHRGSTRDV